MARRRGLDLTRRRPHRHRPWAACAAAGLLLAAGWGTALPRRVDDALRRHYDGQAAQTEQALFALRRRLAVQETAAEENAALRTLLNSRKTVGEMWRPVWAAARWPGGLLLAEAVPGGLAVLDAEGRFAGIAAENGAVETAGCGAGAAPVLVDGALGVLTRRDGTLWVTALPRSCAAQAGDAAVTAVGQYWAGVLAAAPVQEPGALTLCALLTDTADTGAAVYFVGGTDVPNRTDF